MDKIIEMLLPAITVFVMAFVAQHIVKWIGLLFDKALEGIALLGTKLNNHKYLKIAEFDDFLNQRLALAVAGTKDSFVDAIKKANADGKLTKEEMLEATQIAYSAFKDSLTSIELKEVVSILGDDIKRIIMARIPGVVASFKPAMLDAVLDDEDPLIEG